MKISKAENAAPSIVMLMIIRFEIPFRHPALSGGPASVFFCPLPDARSRQA
jgi:hypothetical protein